MRLRVHEAIMNHSDVEQAILVFLRERFGVEPSSPDSDLIEGGILDSMMFVDLIVFIEERFDVTAELDDLEIENFSTVESMARFVTARSPKARSAAS
jgi:acyl carrier protein